MSLIQFKDRSSDIDVLKAKINTYRPVPQEIVAQIKEKFRILATHASSALDGISFDEAETRTVLEQGKAIGGKSVREHLELLGHSEAYDFLWEASRRGNTNLTVEDILKFHQLFYYRINKLQAGKLRKGKAIGNQGEGEAVAPEQITVLLEEFIAS
ncbi:MAG: Fic family protein, partial [Syntrophales bacterium LBB04]|nr:Fic family protein [Syntrophales bacterium LBB04]